MPYDDPKHQAAVDALNRAEHCDDWFTVATPARCGQVLLLMSKGDTALYCAIDGDKIEPLCAELREMARRFSN